MSDTPPSPGAGAGAGARNPLARQLGPFTAGQWAIVAAAGVALGLIVRKFAGGGAGSDMADLPAADTSGTVADPTAYAGGTGGYGFTTQGVVPMNGGAGTATTVNPITDNETWLTRALATLAAQGTFAPADIVRALRRWLDGETLTQQDWAIVNGAIAVGGNPPEYVPAAPVEPSPTTPIPTTPVTPTPPPPTPVPVVPAPAPAPPAPAPPAPEQVWVATAAQLRDLANASVHGGRQLTDAELDQMRGMGFSTGDAGAAAGLDPTFRFYWRFWLDQHGYRGQNAN